MTGGYTHLLNLLIVVKHRLILVLMHKLRVCKLEIKKYKFIDFSFFVCIISLISGVMIYVITSRDFLYTYNTSIPLATLGCIVFYNISYKISKDKTAKNMFRINIIYIILICLSWFLFYAFKPQFTVFRAIEHIQYKYPSIEIIFINESLPTFPFHKPSNRFINSSYLFTAIIDGVYKNIYFEPNGLYSIEDFR